MRMQLDNVSVWIDRDACAAYVKFALGDVCRTQTIEKYEGTIFNVDFDADGKVLGVEAIGNGVSALWEPEFERLTEHSKVIGVLLVLFLAGACLPNKTEAR